MCVTEGWTLAPCCTAAQGKEEVLLFCPMLPCFQDRGSPGNIEHGKDFWSAQELMHFRGRGVEK